MKVLSVSVTDDQYRLLKERSNESGCSYGSIIRTLLTDYFKNLGGEL